MVKENTESKSPELEQQETERSITTKIRILERDSDEKRRKRVRRTIKWNVSIVAFLVVVSVLQGIATGKWDDAIVPGLLGAMWLGLVTILEIENHNKQWIIDMQYGLRELEREEIDTLMADLAAAPGKAVAAAKAAAKAKKGKK